MQAAPLIDLYDHSQLSRQVNTVVNNHSGRTYPLQDNIPVLLHGQYMQGNNSKYQKIYDRLGRGYDFAEKVIGKLFYGDRMIHARREIMQQPGIKNGDKILYVSIGTGIDLSYLPKDVDMSTLQITGVDISMKMLQQCRKNLEKSGIEAELINCCAEALPFEDDYFDVVLHVGGINFFTDKDAAIKEMIRVAKAGTTIMVADETEKLVQQYKKNLFTRGYFNNLKNAIIHPEQMIPAEMGAVQYKEHWENRLYTLIFRKPVTMA